MSFAQFFELFIWFKPEQNVVSECGVHLKTCQGVECLWQKKKIMFKISLITGTIKIPIIKRLKNIEIM